MDSEKTENIDNEAIAEYEESADEIDEVTQNKKEEEQYEGIELPEDDITDEFRPADPNDDGWQDKIDHSDSQDDLSKPVTEEPVGEAGDLPEDDSF